MPRRKRSSKRVGAALTLSRYIALVSGPHPTRGEPDRVLALVWQHHRERLLEDGPRPFGFWAFEPGIPDELREVRPVLEPVDDDEDPEAIRAERDHLEARRAAWLLERDIENISGASGATT